MDEEAAEDRQANCFDLCALRGKGLMQIAKVLTADKVLTVNAYYAKRDGKLCGQSFSLGLWKPYGDFGTPPTYMGCTVNFKTYSKSHKLKKRHRALEVSYLPRHAQPAINRNVFERVQNSGQINAAPLNKRAARFILKALLRSKLHFATGRT